MRRLAFLALLALGCDDTAKLLDVAEHGIVEAQIVCDGTVSDGVNTDTIRYSAQRLLDGSCLANGQHGALLCSRTDACADNCSVELLSFDSGLVVYAQVPPKTAPIESICTGFNLEAFGVEE